MATTALQHTILTTAAAVNRDELNDMLNAVVNGGLYGIATSYFTRQAQISLPDFDVNADEVINVAGQLLRHLKGE